MGRGLSEQQKEILIWLHEEGGSSARWRLRSERGMGVSDVERASVARAITRLVKRGLLERVEGKYSYRTQQMLEAGFLERIPNSLKLTSEGSELAKQLSANG